MPSTRHSPLIILTSFILYTKPCPLRFLLSATIQRLKAAHLRLHGFLCQCVSCTGKLEGRCKTHKEFKDKREREGIHI